MCAYDAFKKSIAQQKTPKQLVLLLGLLIMQGATLNCCLQKWDRFATFTLNQSQQAESLITRKQHGLFMSMG